MDHNQAQNINHFANAMLKLTLNEEIPIERNAQIKMLSACGTTSGQGSAFPAPVVDPTSAPTPPATIVGSTFVPTRSAPSVDSISAPVLPFPSVDPTRAALGSASAPMTSSANGECQEELMKRHDQELRAQQQQQSMEEQSMEAAKEHWTRKQAAVAVNHWARLAASSWSSIFEQFPVPNGSQQERRQMIDSIMINKTTSLNWQQLKWSDNKLASKQALNKLLLDEISELELDAAAAWQ